MKQEDGQDGEIELSFYREEKHFPQKTPSTLALRFCWSESDSWCIKVTLALEMKYQDNNGFKSLYFFQVNEFWKRPSKAKVAGLFRQVFKHL